MASQPPPFENADKCRKCNTGFSLFTRKHHCRNCGRTFCGEHSSASMPLPHYNISEAVRVCAECDQKIRSGAVGRAAPAPAKPSQSSTDAPSGPRRSIEQKDEPISSPPPAKKVRNCTCNSPLCICPPDEEEKPEPVKSSSSNSSSTPAPKKAAPAQSSSAAPSQFMGFGGAQKQKQVWNLKGDLNEQVREAVKAQDLDGVQQLLSAGADARYVDRTGNALAHLAAMFNRYDIIEVLAKHGADLWIKNPAKETPVDLAPPALQRKMAALQPQKE